MIKCEWVGIESSTLTKKGEKKSGRYSASVYPIKDYGVSKWAIHGYLKVNLQNLLDKGMTYKEIVDGCVEFLNEPPPRKKYQKKEPKPRFGFLEPVKASWTVSGYDAKFKDDQIIITLFTNDRKNDNFWGEGYNLMPVGKTPKKRGRKKKEVK